MNKLIYTIISIICFIFFILGIVEYHNDPKVMIYVLLIMAIMEAGFTFLYLLFKRKEK